MHATGLLQIAIVATVALVLGLALQRLRQPAIVGYIFAGVLLGPSGFGLISSERPVEILAEFGVLMLLFIIGMELSLRGFRRVLPVALGTTAAQVALSLAMMLLITKAFDRPTETGVVLGFVVALSSTAVAIKLLEDIGELRSEVGRTAIGVLIAQDLAVVPMLLIINGMSGEHGFNFGGLVKVAVAVGLLALMIAVLTRRERVRVPLAGAAAGKDGRNVELTAISALAYCFGAATLSALAGLSPAYGAFLAGLWIGNSTARAPILTAALPIQGVLLMVFFLSIGLLLDLGFIWSHLAEVLTMLVVVTLFKTAMNVAVLRLVGEPWPRAWLAGVTIGQIGEFSFVLVATATAAGLMEQAGGKLAISVIALSLMLSPLWLLTARRLERLMWANIRGVREVWQSLYGRETTAVMDFGERTGRFALRLGTRGLAAAMALMHLRQRGARPDPKDAAFEAADPPAEGETAAGEDATSRPETGDDADDEADDDGAGDGDGKETAQGGGG